MPRIGFEQLPEHARLWIFAAQRELDDPERARVLEEVDRFIDQWTAHNVPAHRRTGLAAGAGSS